MIIRNTFLNAQMGQIVQYQLAGQKPKEKTLKWIDTVPQDQNKTNDSKSDGTASGPAIVIGTPKKASVAKLVPLKETIAFEKRVSCHHSKTQRDLQSCLKGTRLNRFQKQQNQAGSKSGPLASSTAISGGPSSQDGTN